MEGFMKRVSAVQAELKAPKGQTNKFGGYRYRSCEDILEAVKPLLKKYGLVLTISDEMIQLDSRYYIRATAALRDTESEAEMTNSAYAREAESKKGMDESQITGTASSYARKYALNGLFCIDDTRDADTNSYTEVQQKAQAQHEILCERCGSFLYPVTKRNGETWEVEDMEKYSKRHFGACLCADCMKTAQKEQNNAG